MAGGPSSEVPELAIGAMPVVRPMMLLVVGIFEFSLDRPRFSA